MKKINFVFVLVVAFALFICASGVVSAAIYVPDDYAKIQRAVDNASAGDTIIVRDGIYTENVDVNKDHLTIKSESGAEATIVQAANSNDHVFEVTADYVNISRLTVKGASEYKVGILIESVGCNITNNIVLNNFHGIRLYSSSNNNNITNNNISNNTHGIRVCSSNNNNIANNIVSNNGYGIRLYSSSNNSITNNNVSNSGWGICLDSSSNNSIINNYFENDGILICGYNLSHYNTYIIEGNTINGKPIYYYKDTRDIKVPADAGEVILANCTDIKIENIAASNSTVGIELAYTTESKISNNNVSNSGYGIYLCYSSNNSITNNNASNNEYGICLCSSCNNNITNNIVSNNGYGIYLHWSSNYNTITSNTVNSNKWTGIRLYSCSNNNTIYHNNFINNTDNVYSSDSTNIWNSTSKITYIYNGSTYTNYLGNYWDNYKDKYPDAEEIDETGIWNTPYSIDSDNDSYPLMEPCENYFAPAENIFDTGTPANPYPSIFGTHSGTITPNQTITVNKLYTYPCQGTGGHTEYARIWNSALDVNTTWNGYKGDWHNISFNKTFMLVANETYNYTIRTGSYPQIIHEQNYTTLDGSFINCTKFTDANGKKHTNWIPAIRLE